MGKIKVATLGSEEEQKMRDQRKVKREEKKKREDARVHISGMKGGESIKSVGSEEDIDKLAKIAQEVEKDQSEGLVGASKKEEKPKKAKIRVRSQRYKEARVKVDPTKKCTFSDALTL